MAPYFVENTPGIYDLVGAGPGHQVRFLDPSGTVVIAGTINTPSVTMASATANAYVLQDSLANAYWTIDTRTTTNAVSAHLLSGPNVSIASSVFTGYHLVATSANTLTLTGGTSLSGTAANGISTFIARPAVVYSGTLGTASTLYLQGSPTISGGGTITLPWVLDASTGGSHFGGSLLTDTTYNYANTTDGDYVGIALGGTFGTLGGGITGNIGIYLTTTYSAPGAGGQDAVGIKATWTAPGSGTWQRMGDFIAGGNTTHSVFPTGATVGSINHFAADQHIVNGTISGIYRCFGCSPPASNGTGAAIGTTAATDGIFGFYAGTAWQTNFVTTGSGTTLTGQQNPFRSDGGQIWLDPTMTAASAATTGQMSTGTGAFWDGLSIGNSSSGSPTLLTISNSTSITQTNPGVSLVTVYQPSITAGSSLTVAVGSTVTIQGGPVAAGSALIRAVSLLNLATTGTTTNSTNAAATYTGITINAHTVTLASTTHLTATPAIAGISIGAITISAGSATTVDEAAGLTVSAPIQGLNVTLSNTYGLKALGHIKTDQTVANGSVATAMSSVGPTSSHTTIQEWLTFFNASNVQRWVPCF